MRICDRSAYCYMEFGHDGDCMDAGVYVLFSQNARKWYAAIVDGMSSLTGLPPAGLNINPAAFISAVATSVRLGKREWLDGLPTEPGSYYYATQAYEGAPWVVRRGFVAVGSSQHLSDYGTRIPERPGHDVKHMSAEPLPEPPQ